MPVDDVNRSEKEKIRFLLRKTARSARVSGRLGKLWLPGSHPAFCPNAATSALTLRDRSSVHHYHAILKAHHARSAAKEGVAAEGVVEA